MEPALIPYPANILINTGSFLPDDGFSVDSATVISDGSLTGEHYRLSVTADGVSIYAGTAVGCFRAKSTLAQLLFSNDNGIPCLEIDDEPQFPYRGFHIDSARHMQSIAELEKLIDAASIFKFNYFHWHLSDDQGFRIESERFPLLNEKASFRNSSDFGKNHINERYGGYYTKAEMKHIVEYCAARYIEVIPEIEMPGHTSAILNAFPALTCTGISPGVKTTAGIFKDVLCPGKEETMSFICELIDEISEIFPCDYFHIGGDETPKIRWNNCPACRARMSANGLDSPEQLQLWFADKITGHLTTMGKTAICWNETLKGGTPANSPVIQNWMDRDKLCPEYAENGGKVIMSDFYNYYFDYPYSMTPLKKAYGFDPYKGLSKNARKNLIGVEAALWTEFISDFRRLCFLAYPRFAAVAETGWSQPEHKSYRSFHRRFAEIRPMLYRLGVVPAPMSEWNPNIILRGTGTIGFFANNINHETIMGFFKKSE